MKIFVGSTKPEGLSIALALQAEGHKVYFKGPKGIGSGLIARTGVSMAPQCDYAYLDDAVFVPVAKRLPHSIGVSTIGNLLENDKEYAKLSLPFALQTPRDWLGAFFTGKGFLSPYFRFQVYEHLFDHDTGPPVRTAGVVVRATPPEWCLNNLEGVLAAAKAKGFFAQRMGASGVEVWAMAHYDVLQAITELLKEPLSEVLRRIATGDAKYLQVTQDVAVAVRVSLPPYPHPGEPKDAGAELKVSDAFLKHFWPMSVRLNEADKLVVGSSGLLGCATAHGKNLREARKRVYRTVKSIELPDVQYRTDVGLST